MRRLFAAEQLLREDPAEGFARVAHGYAVSQTPEQRAAILARAADVMGFPDLSGLASADRQELERYRNQVRGAQEHLRASLPRMADSVRSLVESNPAYSQVSKTTAALMRAGEFAPTADGIKGAFEAALGLKGIPSASAQQEAAAKAADQARREKLANAKAAGTPKTTSAHTRAVEPDGPVKSVKAMLEAGWDEIVGAGA